MSELKEDSEVCYHVHASANKNDCKFKNEW